MEAIIINDKWQSDWDKFVHDNEFAIAWQSYEWSQVLKKHYQFGFYPLAACDGAKIRGILPLYRVKTFLAGEALISVPHAVAGGIVAENEEASRLLLDKAIALAQKYAVRNITLKQYKQKINGELRTDDHFYNRELALSKNTEALWGNLAEANKESIKAAEKYNLVLDYPSSNLGRFYQLLLKHHHHTGVPCVSREWIEDLVGLKLYSIALLKANGIIVAGTLVKEFKKTVSFPFTCVLDRSEKSMMFAYALYWELLQRFAAAGKEIFHSGRIPNTDGVDPYRLGWGGAKYNYYYQYYPNSTANTEFAVKRGRKRELLEACWKMAPQAITRLLGPRVVKQLP
jgi:hypothetical protein